MKEQMKCKCGLYPLRLTDDTTFKVACCKCMIGTESKASSKDADSSWIDGDVHEIGIDFKTENERQPNKKFWEFWR